MGYTTTPENVALDGIGANATWLSFHTGNPGSTGANEIVGGSYARVQTTWAAAASASKGGSQVTANIPASTTVSYWGLWTASTGGTFYYGGPVSPANETFGGAGTYAFTPTLTASG